ncbi:MAG: glycosyltransferase [Nocardioides sp.]|uniref:glycosyltransferase n=1 Tax=Nocardioides sp. TaxID=35761 RepID=UPI003D6BEB81
MADLLFVTWGGAGNQVPTIGVAVAAARRGHRVTVAGYADQRSRFESHGFAFRTLERAQRRWPSAPPQDWMPVLADVVWACPDHLDDVADLLSTGEYDAMVVDCLMFGVLAAAERIGVRTAVLVHSAPGALAPPRGGFEQLLMPGVDRVRTAAGLPAIARMWDAWSPFPTFCTSMRELDPLADALPSGIEFVGPVFEPIAGSEWRSPWAAQDTRPLVIVSFSTGPAWDQQSRIRRTVDALGDGSYRLLVTTGPFDVPDLDRPGVVTARHVPHGQVLPGAAVTVTHAGHGTVAASLSHGVPLVALPNPAADQPALAAQVERLGAGIALDGETATPDQIAEAVRTVRADPSFAASARSLADRIGLMPRASGAVALLGDLAAEHTGPGTTSKG